ncbi:hypothetical protein MKW98_031876 [Papaver atlanticum]|uniref:DDE Tnp4 domain-containing protein n=1 Tax=Papaver atlanticum TaxID=357466 RepID=A0AAD4SFC4_9MAGN|nr:hypothetical protein MKW98_031876 [Papaver atlanticum]
MCPYRNIRYWIGDYRRVPPTAKEEKFNQAHARLRNVIERAFWVLKVRFPVLSKMPSYSFETQRDIVIACMSIHNFLRQYENETFDMNETRVEVEVEAETDENAPRLFGRQEQIYMNNLRDEIASLL